MSRALEAAGSFFVLSGDELLLQVRQVTTQQLCKEHNNKYQLHHRYSILEEG